MRRWGARSISGVVALVALWPAACSSQPGVTATESAARGTVGAELGGEPIPTDPATRVLTLENGLVVYLRSNGRPGGSAEMRLVIDAGSAMEGPDQAGVAHFLEHMMFNGTSRFPDNELISVLRDFGMEFGADINAYTSYDETVYQLTVPVDDDDNLGVGLDVLAEWLSSATLADEQVTAERGVVMDEWRVRDQTLDGRIAAALDDMFLAGTAYEGRSPIGDESAIGNMTAEPLRRFYDNWYRPENAAIVVVGDIDVDQVEQLVRDRFAPIAGRGEPASRPDLTVAPFTEAEAVVLSDPDEVQPWVELTYPVPSEPHASASSMRDHAMTVLAFDMIANRLADDITRDDAPFESAFASNNDLVRGLDAPSVYVASGDGSATDTADAVMVEIERALRHGFGQNELARALAYYRSGLEADFDARNTRGDGEYADDFVANFLENATIGTADDEFRVYGEVLDSITAADVAARLVDHVGSSAPHLFVSVPDGSGAPPTSADLLQLPAQIAGRDIQPRAQDAAVADRLMQAPEPVKESSSSAMIDEPGFFLDATRLQFANGAVVILNPTDIADGDIAVVAGSFGGLSVVRPDDARAARYGPSVAAASGLGDLDQVAVATILGGANTDLSPYLDMTSEGFSGTTTPDDLELTLQLMHLYFVSPRFEQSALDAVISEDQAYLDDPTADPDFAAYDALNAARYGDDPRYRLLPTQDELDGLELADVERLFTERFSNASDWVFVFSGDFDIDELTDLARRYVGTLEGNGKSEQWQPVEPEPPTGVVELEVQAGTGATGSLSLLYTVPAQGLIYEHLDAALLTSVLDARLTDHIREALGASYSPLAYTTVYDAPTATVETYVSVSGDPEGLEELAAVVRSDLIDLAKNGPSAAEHQAASAAVQQQYGYLNNMQLAYELLLADNDPDSLDLFLGGSAALERISRSDVQEYALHALPADHYIQVIQRPLGG